MKSQQADKAFQKATLQSQAGRFAEASKTLREALKLSPSHAPSLHLLGLIALQDGQLAAAIDLISAAVEAEPGEAPYRNNLGEALRRAGRFHEAAEEFEMVLGLNPAHAGAHVNLALMFHAQKQWVKAIALYRRALELAPDLAVAWMNLGVAMLEKGEPRNAVLALEQARQRAPDDQAILLNLANALLACDEAARSETLCRQSLAAHPQSAALHLALARALRAQIRVEEALSHDETALSLAPDIAQIRWNLALDLLTLGDYEAGWAEFPARWNAGVVPPHGLSTPEWQGGSLNGQHLLVHAEQGLGDTIQFIRFLEGLSQFQPAEISLLVQRPLKRLLERSALPVTRLVTPDEPLPAHDLRLPLLDLPGRLGVGEQQLGGKTPYLAARPYAPHPEGGLQMGLVWKGRPQHANDRHRSLPLDAFVPLFEAFPGSWLSLQQGVDPAEQAILKRYAIPADGDEFDDLADTADAMAGLDLVITVDTSVAHLAGALGRPVWILLPYAPDWRWMLHRADSPWYPTARLFRQEQPGDWSSVITAVGDALRQLEPTAKLN